MKTTPEKVKSLEPNQVFVFGSNRAGRHGRGAAKDAIKFGAIYGQGDGIQGDSFGISTKDRNLAVLSLREIGINVDRFLRYAAAHPEKEFLVTQIGCGLAGYLPKQIAPMFKERTENVVLPEAFHNVLNQNINDHT